MRNEQRPCHPLPCWRHTLTGSGFILPAVIADQGDKAAERFFTFFTDTIPNANTRTAYYRNVMRFFARMESKGLSLPAIKSYHVSGYLAELTLTGKPQSEIRLLDSSFQDLL